MIGAGIEYLYGKLIKLLPAGIVYGVENPGYRKIPRIYEEYGLSWKSVEMDENGISMESLRESKADVIPCIARAPLSPGNGDECFPQTGAFGLGGGKAGAVYHRR